MIFQNGTHLSCVVDDFVVRFLENQQSDDGDGDGHGGNDSIRQMVTNTLIDRQLSTFRDSSEIFQTYPSNINQRRTKELL